MNVKEMEEIGSGLRRILDEIGIQEVDDVEFCLQDGKFWNYIPRDVVLSDGSLERVVFDLLYAGYGSATKTVPVYPESKRNDSYTDGEAVRVALRTFPGATWYAIFSRETLRLAGEIISDKKIFQVFLP